MLPADDYSGATDFVPGEAECLVFGREGMGAGVYDDIEKVIASANKMVTNFGMAPTLPPVAISCTNASEMLAAKADSDVLLLIQEAEITAKILVEKYKIPLLTVTMGLLID
ncbi:cell division protein FtsH, partial [Trifolium medium]|nr:cell division protein FtsH [Trifolium medium]